MRKIYFLLNELSDYDFQKYIIRYLSKYHIEMGILLPTNPEEYDLVVLWSYRKIISKDKIGDNYIVFHSSDLPRGKGWAPIYYSLAEQEAYYTITALRVAEKVDSGEIIAKVRFKMEDYYMAEQLRLWDNEISIMMIDKILEKFQGEPIRGKVQSGEETYHARRYPKDNEVSLNSRFGDIVPHLRACEKEHPAFFVWKGVRYFIFIKQEGITPPPPRNLEIQFYSK